MWHLHTGEVLQGVDATVETGTGHAHRAVRVLPTGDRIITGLSFLWEDRCVPDYER